MDLRLSAHNRARLKAAAHALGTSETEVIEILLERGLDVAIEREFAARSQQVSTLLSGLSNGSQRIPVK